MDSSKNLSEHLRQAIDDELESLQKTALTLKRRRNGLAPISRLPPETLAIVFLFLALPRDCMRIMLSDKQAFLAWLCASHVCHRWREIALNQPRFWSRIDFTKLTLAGATEVLSRSKMAPLELEANLSYVQWGGDRVDAFGKQLSSHASHISRLNITANSANLKTIIDHLFSSPAPALESLSFILVDDKRIITPSKPAIPYGFFDGTTPRLSHLLLDHCGINWSSLLFKSLRVLELYQHARPSLEEWLDAMEQMSQLETLIVSHATPRALVLGTPILEPTRIITHPSLTKLHLTATASDCTFALSHLILPALVSFRVDATSELASADDVRALIPHFSRHAYGPQDAEPLQSIMINGKPSLTEVILWTTAGADMEAVMEVISPISLINAALSARAIFTVSGTAQYETNIVRMLDATLAALPLDSLNSLTAQTSSSRIPEWLWLAHTPRWSLLERVRLVGTVTKSFTSMLTKDAPPEGPLLPSLTKLTLFDIFRIGETSPILDMLIGRVEQGVPLGLLDLHGCELEDSDRDVQLLGEVVVDIKVPDVNSRVQSWWPTLSNWIRHLGHLSFHMDMDSDEYDSGDSSDDSSDDGLVPNHPLFTMMNNLEDDDDGDDDDDEEEEEDEEFAWM